MIYIRADMNGQIATGHIMRCLSIADALIVAGESVTFILADEQAVDLLKQRGYDAIVLHTEWNQMEKELPALSHVIEKNQIKKLLIDSYQVTPTYLSEVSRLVTTFYMDDLNKFDYPVNAVICYANYYKKFHYKMNDRKTECLLGTKYVPLKKSFWDCKPKNISTKAEKILILTGGSDPYNVSGQLLNAMNKDEFKSIDVICGRYNTNYNALAELYRKYKNIKFHRAINNVEEYMQKADIAISAGGTTLYELCACGMPTISYAFADNQLDNVKQFQEDGLIDYAGDARIDDIAENVNQYLKKYQDDWRLREKKSAKMQEMVDGKGAMRLAEALMKF